LVIDIVFFNKLHEKICKIASVLFTFFLVIIGCVFFRTTSLDQAFVFITRMFTPAADGQQVFFETDLIVTLIMAFGFSFFMILPFGAKVSAFIFNRDSYTDKQHLIFTVFSVVLLFLCTCYISSSSFNPFIYFRF